MGNETSPLVRKRYAELAARQHGLVKTQQIELTSGALTKCVANGSLHRKYRGVYAVGHPGLSREGEWLAAVFAAGDGAALASFSAAFSWATLRFEPAEIHVAVPTRRRAQAGFRLHFCPDLDPRDVIVWKGIPVTTVARTLVDLNDVLDVEELANVIHEAAYRQRFDLQATHGAMARSKRRRRILEAALELHLSGSAGTRSRLEKRFLMLARGAGLGEPIKNTHVFGLEVDFRWGTLCVEVDGAGHRRARTKAEDRIRNAVLHANGFTVLRFSEEDVDQRPQQVLAQLAAQQLP